MSFLRWLVALSLALSLGGCIWRPPPIPPDRAVSDSGAGGTQDTGAETPADDAAFNAGDALVARDSGERSDAIADDASEHDAADGTSDDH